VERVPWGCSSPCRPAWKRWQVRVLMWGLGIQAERLFLMDEALSV
jgi:hypothetical protein